MNKNQKKDQTMTKEESAEGIVFYSDAIAKSPDDLGRTEVLQHHINTKDAISRWQQARRVPLPH